LFTRACSRSRSSMSRSIACHPRRPNHDERRQS
jgi:hypothetical protein